MCKRYQVIGDIGSAVASMISGTRHKNFPFITFTDDSGPFEELVNQKPSSNITVTAKYLWENVNKLIV